MWLESRFVEAGLEPDLGVRYPFLEGVKQRHEDFSSACSCIGLGTEALLACNDRRTKLALGAIVMGRDSAVGHPRIKAVGVFGEDVLDVPHPKVLT